MHIRVPGRTELAGNHTDHQGGHVLAAAVDLYLGGDAQPGGKEIVLHSAGFGELRVDMARLSKAHSRDGTAAALARGVIERLAAEGWRVAPFSAELTSDIPAGAGLSSSAAFAVWVGRAVSALFNENRIPPLTLALAAQYAENVHFGKPCGLMDQCACAFGGVVSISFQDAARPAVTRLETGLWAPEQTLLLVETGDSHRDLTADYAAIPREMGAVAAYLGAERLSEVSEAAVRAALPELRRALGDRAVLRALHYYGEDRRAREMAGALARGDAAAYLAGMEASGRSSAELLQNSFSPAAPQNQGVTLALALCRDTLGGRGAARVHGGGFAGTVQALCPRETEDALRAVLEPVFGQGCCRRLCVAD